VIVGKAAATRQRKPAFGADVLRLWVSSVDYSADVPLGGRGFVKKQCADVEPAKVRNQGPLLLGNLPIVDPQPQSRGRFTVPMADCPLLDRWMLHRNRRADRGGER